MIETSALSALLDPSHKKHKTTRQIVGDLDRNAPKFVSAIALAEIQFGLKLVEAFEGRSVPALEDIIRQVGRYAVLDVTRHTANSYAELKANLAKNYLKKANRRKRPRWIEDWVDKNTGQRLQIDENDLWMCAQAKERELVLVTADKGINRIASIDSEVRLLVI